MKSARLLKLRMAEVSKTFYIGFLPMGVKLIFQSEI